MEAAKVMLVEPPSFILKCAKKRTAVGLTSFKILIMKGNVMLVGLHFFPFLTASQLHGALTNWLEVSRLLMQRAAERASFPRLASLCGAARSVGSCVMEMGIRKRGLPINSGWKEAMLQPTAVQSRSDPNPLCLLGSFALPLFVSPFLFPLAN